MNLVIDIGNSSTKLAVFAGDRMTDFIQVERMGTKELENILSVHPGITHCILSSVRKKDLEMVSLLEKSCGFFLLLDHKTSLPIRNLYRSKSTLGYDRIAAAVGACTRFPGSDLLVIDAGTAITIDMVTADRAYHGGNISPGTSMRFRALHEFTDNLPLVTNYNTPPLMGSDTEGAIASGVLNGIIFELDGYISEQKKRYPDLKAVMTGGDAKIFDKMLKNS